MDSIKEAAKLIKNSKKVMALTGAGISTDSGIPDFRGKNGYYKDMDPINSLSKERLLKEPQIFYKEGYKILLDLNDKKPNQGHIALAKMEEDGFIKGVITQNIDNLHHKAGSKIIYEVHGETRGIHCMTCGRSYPFKLMQEKVEAGEIPPKCTCGGILRPNVIMFGDMMPEDFSNAIEEMQNTQTLIVVGTSLTVSPVNMLPRYAENLIIINESKTPYDTYAKFVFHKDSSEVLTEILRELEGNDL